MDDLIGKIIIAVITAGLTIFGTWLVSGYTNRNNRAEKEKERRRHAEYLAVRIVCVLDPFVSRCVEITGDDGEGDSTGVYRITVPLPELVLPTDVEWKSITPEMMYRILSLQNEIDISKGIVSTAFWQAGGPDFYDGFRERQFQFAKIGTLAFKIVSDLRAQYSIPTPDYTTWNPKDYLDKAFVGESELRKRNSEMIQRMVSQTTKL